MSRRDKTDKDTTHEETFVFRREGFETTFSNQDKGMSGFKSTDSWVEPNSQSQRKFKALKYREIAISAMAWSTVVELLLHARLNLHLLANDGNKCIDLFSLSVISLLRPFIKIADNWIPAGSGFFYGQIWLLMWIESRFGTLPSLSKFFVDFSLGRISLKQNIFGTCFHLAVVALVWSLIGYLTQVEDNKNLLIFDELSIYDEMKEATLQGVMVVGLHVLPVLLSLNGLPELFWTGLIMCPIYFVAVDSTGRGSSLSPTVLMIKSSSYKSFGRVCAQILGIVGGGLVVQRYFPDDGVVAAK